MCEILGTRLPALQTTSEEAASTGQAISVPVRMDLAVITRRLITGGNNERSFNTVFL
jgi:hypothetical protein